MPAARTKCAPFIIVAPAESETFDLFGAGSADPAARTLILERSLQIWLRGQKVRAAHRLPLKPTAELLPRNEGRLKAGLQAVQKWFGIKKFKEVPFEQTGALADHGRLSFQPEDRCVGSGREIVGGC